MADEERYYGVGVFSDAWKEGEEATEGGLIKGTASLVEFLMNGTDTVKDFHGIREAMYEGLEIRVVRVSKAYYDEKDHMRLDQSTDTKH